MDWTRLERWLEEKRIGRWQVMAPLSAHTSWAIGGPARLMAWPKDEEAFVALMAYATQEGYPLRLLGLGTNLLVADEGVEALVIHTGELRELRWESPQDGADSAGGVDGADGADSAGGVDGADGADSAGSAKCASSASGASGADGADSAGSVKGGSADIVTVVAGAGLPLAWLAAAAARQGYTGLEFAAGIPGSLGGALAMNAGAYGSQIADLVVSIKIVDRDGQIRFMGKEEAGYGYRTSGLKESGQLVLGGCLRLRLGDRRQSLAQMEEYLAQRRKNQPLDLPSGGSVFRNPSGGGAGRFIEGAGLKGHRIGAAQISPLHANFIVNLGGATSGEVMGLMDKAREAVRLMYGVELDSEIIYWA